LIEKRTRIDPSLPPLYSHLEVISKINHLLLLGYVHRSSPDQATLIKFDEAAERLATHDFVRIKTPTLYGIPGRRIFGNGCVMNEYLNP
jgi:hypothetical protein